jgi:hypothetical protein
MKILFLLPVFFVFALNTCKTRKNDSENKNISEQIVADSTRMADSVYSAAMAAQYFLKQEDSARQHSISKNSEQIPIVDSFHRAYFITFDRLFNLSKAKECSSVPYEKGVNLFRLNDDSAIHAFLGYHLPLHDLYTDHPYYECKNESGTEVLRLVFLEGGVYDFFEEMEIRPADTTKSDRQLQEKSFISTDGIHLGMNRKEVIGKNGNCYASSGIPGNDSIVYTRKDDELFFRYYVFHNDQLIYYRFGNIYP